MAERRGHPGDGVNLRGGIKLWYSTAPLFENDDMSDLAWVGGTPDEERELEDGIEALPRSVIRTLPSRAERFEETLPDLDELWGSELERDKSLAREDALQEVEPTPLPSLPSVGRSIFSGDPVTPRCPECEGQCVYNGNYFCTRCEWALPGYELLPSPSREWLHKWFEEAFASLMAYRERR